MAEKEELSTEKQRLNRLSLTAFLLSLLLVVGVLAAVLGHVALGQVKKSNDRGRGFALFAIFLGWICTAFGIWFAISPNSVGYVIGFLFETLTP